MIIINFNCLATKYFNTTQITSFHEIIFIFPFVGPGILPTSNPNLHLLVGVLSMGSPLCHVQSTFTLFTSVYGHKRWIEETIEKGNDIEKANKIEKEQEQGKNSKELITNLTTRAFLVEQT